jgi:hypothetical protein
MVEKMAAVEEAKKAAPTDVLPLYPPSDGQHLPPNCVSFKRKRWFRSRGGTMAAWFVTQGPSLLNNWTMLSRRPLLSGVAVLCSTEGPVKLFHHGGSNIA